MALTDHVITSADVGQTIGPDGGWLVGIRQSKSQTKYEVPSGNDGAGRWLSGYIQLRGARDVRDLFCVSPQTTGLADAGKQWLINASIRYAGALKVMALPAGSEWAITLSDQPVVRSTVDYAFQR